jgi:ParB family transcriptional regulator, chromosome partitioning protein
MTRDEAIAWKESENLHRNDLSPLEESISIANYAAARRLLSKADGKRNGGKQPHDEDISGTARALRIDRRRVQRARAHFMLPMSVKKVVLQYNALNKLKILDELAKLKTENEQHSYIRRMVPSARRKERRKSSTEKKRARSRRSLTSGEELSLAIAKGAWRRSGLGNYLSRKSNAVRAAFLRVVSSQN